MSLKGKRVIVTGGSKGLGLGIVKRLCEEGANLIITYNTGDITEAKACAEAGIPYIYGAISGWTAQAAVFMPGDHLLETLYPEGIQARDTGALSFTAALCAAMQASLCVRLLTGRPLETGKLHCVDLLGEEYQQIPLK